MAWKIEFTSDADRDLAALDATARLRILKYIFERLARSENPRALGLPLKGQEFNKTWRFRVGDYRILTQIEDDIVTISVIEIGHRREIYR